MTSLGSSRRLTPLVSAIIPTARRPQLVQRAIKSVLAQTMPDLELIVVVDGPNPETSAAIAGIKDPRVRVCQNETAMGPGPARNAGVDQATGQWVAFLDDDDEWLPAKLERQLTLTNGEKDVIVSCLSNVMTPSGRDVWPRRAYNDGMPLDEYLFDRRALFMGDTYIQTSSLLVSREVCRRFRFPPLRLFEDQEFLLRATKIGNTKVITVPEVLVTVHTEEQRGSLSSTYSWRSSLDWIDSNRALVGARAYSGFCLTVVAPQAATTWDWRGLWASLYQAFRRGSPRPVQVAFCVAAWLLPMRLRRKLRGLWARASRVSHDN